MVLQNTFTKLHSNFSVSLFKVFGKIIKILIPIQLNNSFQVHQNRITYRLSIKLASFQVLQWLPREPHFEKHMDLIYHLL